MQLSIQMGWWSRENIELEYLCVQTHSMHYNSKKFHDIIYVDISNGTNKHGMGLIIFSGINHEKQNVLLGYAMVLEDEYRWYYNVFGTFFKMFLFGKTPQTVITDINFEMSKALTDVLSPETKHIFCQWHVKRYLKTRFLQLNNFENESWSHMIYDAIMSCIFLDEVEEFLEYQNFIFCQSSDNVLTQNDNEFLKSLFLIKEKWAKAYMSPKLFLASDSHNIVRAESLNQMIQTRLFRDSTLTSVFKMICDIEEQNNERYSYENWRETIRDNNIIHPILRYVKRHYSQYWYSNVLNEFKSSHSWIATVYKSKLF